MTAPVLVTGAGGFIGAGVVRALRRAGRPAVALTREQADVTNAAALTRLFRDHNPAVVINAAVYGADPRQADPVRCFAVNFDGLMNVASAAAAAGAGRVVQLGSCFEYGTVTKPAHETDPVRPLTAYAASKAAATLALAPLARALRIEAIALRLFGVWGEGEGAHRLVPQILAAAEGRKRLALTAGAQVRDLSYVDDVADRIVAAAFRPDIGAFPIVNIASGRPVAIRSFAEDAARAASALDLLDFGALPYRPGESMFLAADVTRQKALLGEISVTSVADGVRRMTANRHPTA